MAGDFLARDAEHGERSPGPAIGRRHAPLQQSQLGELGDDLVREAVVVVDLIGDRRDFLVGEAAHLITENALFLAEMNRREGHGLGPAHAAIEREQTLPMALGRWFVVAPAFGEREAMMDVGMDFQLASRA